MPKVSVVIPFYNDEEYFPQTLETVLNQTFSDFEVLIVDSGSDKFPSEIVETYQDSRVRLFTVHVNCGEFVPRNLGIKASQGEYIAIMDADDLMHPERLGKQADFLDQNCHVDVIGTNFSQFDGTDYSKRQQPLEDKRIRARLLFVNGNALHNPTVMMRRAFLEEHSLMYPPLVIDSDHAMWIACMREGATFANLEEDLLIYRRHSTNLSKGHSKNQHVWKTSLRKDLLGLYFPDLTLRECDAVARLMENGRRLELSEAFAGIHAVDKVMRMGHCEMGADLNEVKKILIYYRDRVVKALQKIG